MRRYLLLINHQNNVEVHYFWTIGGALDAMRSHVTRVLLAYAENAEQREPGIWYRLYFRCKSEYHTWHNIEQWGGYNYLNDLVAGMPSGMEKKRS